MLSLPIREGWGKEVIKEEACGYFPCSCAGIEWHADEKESRRERKGEERGGKSMKLNIYIYIYKFSNDKGSLHVAMRLSSLKTLVNLLRPMHTYFGWV